MHPAAPKRKASKRQQRKTKKLIPKTPVRAAMGFGAAPQIREQVESRLTPRERKLVDFIVARMRKSRSDALDLKFADYRYWEIKQKTGWNPDWQADPRETPAPANPTVYDWWITLDVDDRGELAALSAGAGMKDNENELEPVKRRKAIRDSDAREDQQATRNGHNR